MRLKAVAAYCISMLMILFAGILQAQTNPVNRSEQGMAAYLMVYFKDDTHGLYMALSADGYSFTDVNNGLPIMAGDTLAEQKGIRDPHIYRGPDNNFYMVMTDLHIFAQKDGLRKTKWQRSEKQYGWGNNNAILLMKSADLIHWQRTDLRVDKAFPELKDIGCAWAPETIYDPAEKKMMIYFTMRFGNGLNKLYYAYADKAFTKLVTKPKLLFNFSKKGSYIDGDITEVDGKYHLFYVAHDGQSGIKQTVSDALKTGYTYDSTWYDPEPKACEAPTVWKRIGEQKWVLMYDIFGITPSYFGFSETADFIHFKNLGHFNEGPMKSTNFSSPKHGAVIQITKSEAQRLAAHWNMPFGNKL